MAISEQWPQLLEPGLREIFFAQLAALQGKSQIPVLFKQLTSTKATEAFLGVGGMGDWKKYKGAIEYDDFDELYKTTLTHDEFVNAFAVERKLVDDDQYNIINARPAGLAIGAARKREKDAASIFNNATSASYLGGDGVALLSDSHPLAPTHSADVIDNKLALALSYDNLISARNSMMAFTDDRTELINIEPDTLLVPPALEQTAMEIFRTTNKPNTADYVINFTGGWLRNVIKWPYLTDTNRWFLIDSTLAKQHLIWDDRVATEFALDPASDYNLVARYRGYMRYSYGWSDFRWVIGSEPS